MDLARGATDLFTGRSRGFAVRLWDGTLLPPDRSDVEPARGRVVFTTPRGLAALLPPASELRLAEAFLDGDIELEGDTIGLLESAAAWEGPRLRSTPVPVLVSALVRRTLERPGAGPASARLRGKVHSMPRDGDAVRHHYDVSDRFYRLFLDRSMVYSCAYFETGGETLDEAQRKKLELICRKLALRPGDELLDVGCGWGALLEHAARSYHVHGVGITLSVNQLAEARRRATQLAPAEDVSIVAADYRDLPAQPRFHKVASVGMMEHVGRARLARYFAAVHGAMHAGGLFLNHAIADVSGQRTLRWSTGRGGGFIARYVFPDGDLVPLPTVLAAAEGAGFEVRDVESLREHYAETLAAWLRRFESRFAEAEALVGTRRARAYRLYLAASAAAFRIGRISVFQVLLAKRSSLGRAVGVPRSRESWSSPRSATTSLPGLPGPRALTSREPSAQSLTDEIVTGMTTAPL